MINISLSVYRLFGEPLLISNDIEGVRCCLTIRDSSDEFPIMNQIQVNMINADPAKIKRAIQAFNKEMSND